MLQDRIEALEKSRRRIAEEAEFLYASNCRPEGLLVYQAVLELDKRITSEKKLMDSQLQKGR